MKLKTKQQLDEAIRKAFINAYNNVKEIYKSVENALDTEQGKDLFEIYEKENELNKLKESYAENYLDDVDSRCRCFNGCHRH